MMLEPAKILDRNLVFFAINDNTSGDSIGGSHWWDLLSELLNVFMHTCTHSIVNSNDQKLN